jgi:hypothetical protein
VSAKIRPYTVALVTVAALYTALALYGYVSRGPRTDFRLFYDDGAAMLTGTPLYVDHDRARNMNPPSLTVLVFAPLALLPFWMAQAVWLMASLAAVAVSGVAVVRALRPTTEQVLLTSSAVLLTLGSFDAWSLGQLTWPVLFLPVTMAWLAYREGRARVAGAWLAVAVVAKPPLALMALLLPMPVWITAGVISATVSAMLVPVTGWSAWQAWLDSGAAVDWVNRAQNGSLWGLVARWEHGTSAHVTMADIGVPFVLMVVVVAGGLAWHCIHTPGSARFIRAGLWSVLVSPLGWDYYLPLLAVPIAAGWPGGLAWVAYALALPAVRLPGPWCATGAVIAVAWVALHWEREAHVAPSVAPRPL